ncbi:MAG: hypothetical protein COW00_18005 [Bdellovibrio sp. CG12_big_fil_rev_8_21_14_0_65_39_13]|nr:MAG: hypothetical protein COW78_06165 [Bdellovibrio sp. CG22_combo_CG10-13_8_21_14_all_39_27]PIQ58003.1 MAG: hypothetical protein COW00_18005 [Bdellovibrio sp. CG12_big_fil_rev_8_21_14_0_65_39_13]PIR36913.1 MAG: hypothetical protein COV37_00035 [Bdellovibrio sp. CG11_big_fil_rev_8_21_14_0_20_39_38]
MQLKFIEAKKGLNIKNKKFEDEDKDDELIDQGPCLFYWQLSFRRRLIRDFYVIGISLLIAIITYFSQFKYKYYIFLFPVFGVPQIIYNYYNWQKKERTPFWTNLPPDPKALKQINDLKSATKFEAKLTLMTGALLVPLALAGTYLQELYFKYIFSQFDQTSTFFFYQDEFILNFFMHLLLFLFPTMVIVYKYAQRKMSSEKMELLFASTERIWGFSKKWSQILLSFVFGLTSILGFCFILYSYFEYSIFSNEKIVIQSGVDRISKNYTFNEIKSLTNVKFFNAPNGKPVYHPHFIIEFSDGFLWLSKDHISEGSVREKHFADFLESKTELKFSDKKYFDN